jgi:hypothetical protein
MGDSSPKWGGGAAQAESLGEGDPKAWEKAGLGPMPREWLEVFEVIDDLCVACYQAKAIRPENIRRVVGGACIHRSEGRFADLPITFLWEILSVALVGTVLRRPALILLPIAEESFRSPEFREAYLHLGGQIRNPLQALSIATRVAIEPYWTPQTWELKDVDVDSLYGLFYPFSSSGRLRTYPFGEPDEAKLLEAYASYCARYRHLEGGLQADDLVVEGIHTVQSVMFGIRDRANYLATVPLPLDGGGPIATHFTPVPTISESVTESPEWWPNRLLLKIFGLDLESLRSRFVDEGFVRGPGNRDFYPACAPPVSRQR